MRKRIFFSIIVGGQKYERWQLEKPPKNLFGSRILHFDTPTQNTFLLLVA